MKTYIHEKFCSGMLITALFITGNNPNVYQQKIKETNCDMLILSNKKEQLKHTITWMNLTNIILIKRRYIPQSTYCIVQFL